MSRKLEIERKYLIDPAKLPPLSVGSRMAQGYLGFDPTVRVRVEDRENGRIAYLTIKGPGLVGRDEFEYEIPVEEGEALLGLAQSSVVRKTRYRLPAEGSDGLVWEVDLFEGDNEGLAVAEIEMPAEGCRFRRPVWVLRDVTENPAYKNSALSQHPYSRWSPQERGA